MPVLLIIIPFALLAVNGTLKLGQEIGLVIVSLAILSGMVRERMLKYFIWYVCCWAVFARFELLLGGTRGNACMDMVFYLIVGVSIYIGASRSNISNTAWFNFICVAALIQATLAILQKFGVTPVFDMIGYIVRIGNKPSGNFAGTLENCNFLTAFLVISLPFFFRKYWRCFIPIPLYVILFAGVSGSVIAMTVGVIYYFRLYKVKYIALLAACVVVFMFLDNGTTINDIRWEWWSMTVKKICTTWESILFGFGPGVKIGLSGSENHNLHNDWLHLWLNLGLFGIAFILAYIYNLKKNRLFFTAFLIGCTCALTTQLMFVPVNALLMLCIMGLMERDKWQSIRV